MEKPCATFYKKKIVLNGVLRAVFPYSTLEKKKSCKHQPDELDNIN